jgi:hypothetical protein
VPLTPAWLLLKWGPVAGRYADVQIAPAWLQAGQRQLCPGTPYWVDDQVHRAPERGQLPGWRHRFEYDPGAASTETAPPWLRSPRWPPTPARLSTAISPASPAAHSALPAPPPPPDKPIAGLRGSFASPAGERARRRDACAILTIGPIPVRATRPVVGLMPTSELAADGPRIDPEVSVPMV